MSKIFIKGETLTGRHYIMFYAPPLAIRSLREKISSQVGNRQRREESRQPEENRGDQPAGVHQESMIQQDELNMEFGQ